MLGNPKYKIGDDVLFKCADKEKVGCIVIVDKWGTFFDKSDVCYDIQVWEENCLYKHFNEKNIICKYEQVMETENLKPIISFEDRTKDEYTLKLGNYQLEERDGVLYAKRKTTRYPTTASECALILPVRQYIGLCKELPAKYAVQLKYLSQLLVYRDAYWQLAGEEMGLSKPWEPDWTSGKPFYCISVSENIIVKGKWYIDNKILAFPTEEMRDVFYENFKDLIENCKELL